MARTKMAQLEALIEMKAKGFEEEAAKNHNNMYNVRSSIQKKADADFLKSTELRAYLRSAGILSSKLKGKSRAQVMEMIKDTTWYKEHKSTLNF
jgi:hypothetical protein